MNSFEKIGLIVLFFISLIYSYVKPTAIVENIQTKQNIVIYVEGEFEKKLSFKTKPTINDVLTKLQTDNHYQFNENYQLTNESKLYLPHGQNLISLNHASLDDLMALKGIGEKTAINLLEKYGSLDGVYENLEDISPKTREKLITDKENAYMSYDLATIYREVPIDFTLEDCKYNGYDFQKFKSILEELEFHSLLRKINFDMNSNDSFTEKMSKKEDKILLSDISTLGVKPFSFYLETRGTVYSKSTILGVGIYDGEKGYFLSPQDIEKHKDLFQGSSSKMTYDLKKSIVVLNNLGIKINNCNYDAMIGMYLLDYTVKDDISFVASSFDYNITPYEDSYGTEKRPKDVDLETLKQLCCSKAKFIYETKEQVINELKENEEESLFKDIEMPLTTVLADMEITGIKVDKEYLGEIEIELKKKMDELEKDIYSDAMCEFNIMSPSQLAKVLFEDLKIRYPKKTKDNKYSTSKDILDKIIYEHPIVPKILEYRTLAKLYTNYAVGLKTEVRDDGRIHTIFTQTLTRTGRLSSISPNLQNIPARSDFSKLIRKAFIADEDSVLMSSDYSQVELRVFASMSNEKNLIDAFKKGKDIHTKTASEIFKVPIEEVTKDMRRSAKAVNFGILYGISSFGLSEDLGIDMKEAKSFIENYLNTFPGIHEFMEQEKKDAYEKGYVRTLMNRKRVVEELKSKNYMIRSSGERMALNTPIQGTAADILKKAMVEIYSEFNKRGLKSKMLIQVHDELVFNVIKSELEEVKQIVKDIMENTFTLKVPLKVDIEIGNNWYEAK